jgi:hypothetical protein
MTVAETFSAEELEHRAFQLVTHAQYFVGLPVAATYETDAAMLRYAASLAREVETLRANEGVAARTLSDVLSGGNAATWDEIFDAAKRLTAENQRLKDDRERAFRAGFADGLESVDKFGEQHDTADEAWQCYCGKPLTEGQA